MSPGRTIRLVFFWDIFLCFIMLILSLPLLGLGSKSTSLNHGFYVVFQGNTIRSVWSRISFLDSFLADCLGGGNQQMWLVSCRRQGMLIQGLASDLKCKLIISSFLTLLHFLNCLSCTRNPISTVLLLLMMLGWYRWRRGGGVFIIRVWMGGQGFGITL